MSQRRTARLAVLALAALPLVLSSAAPAFAQAKISCKEIVAVLTVDPILHHNQGVAGHQHQFFGNTTIAELGDPSAALATSLQGKGTTCENASDTAAYWEPTLRNRVTKRVLVPDSFTAYYRSASGDETGPAEAIPFDTRLVAMTDDTRFINWTCGQLEGVALSTSIPDCSGASGGPGRQLTSHITFPSCWDGVQPRHTEGEVGDTSDTEHYAYRQGGTCPKSFPIGVTELRMTTSYDYTGDGTDLELSSDAMVGTKDGASLHGDFWQTWESGGLEDLIADCIVNGEHPTFRGQCG